MGKKVPRQAKKSIEEKMLTRQKKEEIENKIVLSVIVIFTYGFLLAIFYNLLHSSIAKGSRYFITGLGYASIAAFLALLIFAIVRKTHKHNFLILTAAFLALSCFAIVKNVKFGVGASYCGLGIGLIASNLYYFFELKRKCTSKTCKIIYFAVTALLFLAAIGYYVYKVFPIK